MKPLSKIVIVEWEDSAGRERWCDIGEIPNTMKIETVGYLIEKNRKCVKVASSFCLHKGLTPDVANTTAIPMGCVSKITTLWEMGSPKRPFPGG